MRTDKTTPIRRLYAALLALVLACSLVPAPALAELADALSDSVAVEQAAPAEEGQAESEEAPEAESEAPSDAGAEKDGEAPEVAPEPETAPEAEAEPEAEAAPEAEAEPEPEAEVAPEPEAEVAPEPETAPEPDAVPEDAPADDEEVAPATVSASLQLVGIDSFGADQVWVANAAYDVAEGTTAAGLIEQVLDAAGLVHTSSVGEYGYYLEDITSADGRKLGYDTETGKYWQLFVNGKASDVGAGSVTLAEGDSIVLYYSAYGATLDDIGQAKVTVTASVTGPNAEGADASWVGATEVSLPAGSTAADLTEQVLDAAGLEHVSSVTEYGYYLESITSSDGRTLAYDSETGAFWQLFVNGKASEVGASSVTLKSGDQVFWYYAASGAELPQGEGDVTVDPDAARPDYGSDWSGFGNGSAGASTSATTPTETGELAWATRLKDADAWGTYASDPIIVNGDLYVAVGSELRAYDAATGELKASAPLATTVDSVARMVYADGIVVVPLHGGRLQALTADTLTTVWLTDELPADETNGAQQSLSTLTVANGYVYFGTAAADWSSTTSGYLRCVSLATGAVRWTCANTTSGYYWAGAASVGGWLVVADDAGTVHVVDASTGADHASLSLGAAARSTVVSGGDGSTAYVVTRDAVLHKLSIAADGTASELGSVQFGTSSTSTPTIVGGRAFVGGATTGYKGVLAVIDLATMTVEAQVTTTADGEAIPGDVKATPVVSTQGTETYVYFTANAEPGGVYLYHLGDASAQLLFSPEGELANYCMASVVVGTDGALYYVNDSGNLFKVVSAAAPAPDPEPENPDGQNPDGEKPGAPGEQNPGGQGQNPGSGSGNGSGAGTGTGNGSGSGVGTAVKPSTAPVSKGTATSAAPVASPEKASADAADEAADDDAEDAPEATSDQAEGADGRSGISASSSTVEVTAQTQAAQVPVWPIVGIVVGVAVLALAITQIVRNRRA